MTEIADGDLRSCDGLRGVIHQRYAHAREVYHRLFDPIIDQVLSQLG